MQLLTRSTAIILLALLSACSSLTKTGAPAPVEERSARTAVIPSTPAPEETHRPASPSASAAWQPLLAQAGQAAGRGDYEQALALLERAQRIDPDSAEVYLEMAKTHAARGDTVQARAVAERGLLYCSSASQCAALRAFTR
jgi:tetratricopeptide (TPR) repeat protein